MHQFVVYMKSHNRNIPDSLLQQFNFEEPTTDASVKVSEETAVENEREVDSDDEDQSAPKRMGGC